MSLTNFRLLTYHDAVEHVLDVMAGGDTAVRNRRLARRAVALAYDELVNHRHWTYLNRRFLLTTAAQINTGTLTYDQTGGAFERLVTLSDAVVPTNVSDYELLVNSVRYEIEDYKSSTTFTLAERTTPGIDVAALTAYSLVRHTYPLPDDFRKMAQLQDPQNGLSLPGESSLAEVIAASRQVTTASVPTCYAQVPALRYSGGLGIMFGPSPITARTYDFIYQAGGKALVTEQEFTGNATAVSGSAAIVGVSTDFAAKHAGAVIRFGDEGDDLPTSAAGNLDDVDNVYAMQSVIKSVTDSTNLTLQQAASASLSGVSITISDRIDIEAGAMLTAFLRLCEAHFGLLDKSSDWVERRKMADLEVLRASENDRRSYGGPTMRYAPMRLSDVRSIP